MPEQIRCPKCGSENVIFSKKRSIHVCEDCGHDFTPATTVVPLRIFLSYGHDSNEGLVQRIKTDLESRGHDVWFDKNPEKEKGITPGDNWRCAITEGILKSNRVVSFLSKHSTRDPGVCLDEIAIAIGVKGGNIQTILVESEKEVNPPPSISHIQWLDMHDWQDRYAAGDAEWEPWYQSKLNQIIAVVESDTSRRFVGEIEALHSLLKPTTSDFSCDSRIRELLARRLVGRTWMFNAIEQWRNAADRSSRLFWLMGSPGIGKSAFAAHLAHRYGRGTVIAVHFCDWQKPDHRDAHRIVRTLAFQVATRLPEYRQLLLRLPEIAELDRTKKSAFELFDYLLADPLHHAIDGGRERYLIIIDALDEASANEDNELVQLLARSATHLPDWIGILVTSRPELNVRGPLQGLNPFPFDATCESNCRDVREYLQRELEADLTDRPDAGHVLDQILERSEALFLYAEHFCDEVRRGHLSLDRPEEFPQGLGGIFHQYFQRQFPELERFRHEIRPALRAILAAREPLPLGILQSLFNWQDEELYDRIRPLGALFPITTGVISAVITPYHKSLADWLLDETKAGHYFVSVNEGHQFLAEWCWHRYVEGTTSMPMYCLRHLALHLAASARWKSLSHILRDPIFIRHKRDTLSYVELATDFVWIDECLAETTKESERLLLKEIATTVRELRGFAGRNDVEEQIEHALHMRQHQHILLLGSPGVGKSTLMQHLWLSDFRNRVKVRFLAATSGSPRGFDSILADVQRALAARVDGTAVPLNLSRDLPEQLRLAADRLGNRIVVLVDGLDEVLDSDGCLLPTLPRNPCFLWASRARTDVLHLFQRDCYHVHMHGMHSPEVALMVRNLLGNDATEREVQGLAERSDGNPLYIRLHCDAVKRGETTLAESPPTLADVYRKALLAVTETCPERIVKALANSLVEGDVGDWVDVADLCRAEPSLRPVLKRCPLFMHRERDGGFLLKVFHTSVTAFLRDTYAL